MKKKKEIPVEEVIEEAVEDETLEEVVSREKPVDLEGIQQLANVRNNSPVLRDIAEMPEIINLEREIEDAPVKKTAPKTKGVNYLGSSEEEEIKYLENSSPTGAGGQRVDMRNLGRQRSDLPNAQVMFTPSEKLINENNHHEYFTAEQIDETKLGIDRDKPREVKYEMKSEY